jgi:hypothetical protein
MIERFGRNPARNTVRAIVHREKNISARLLSRAANASFQRHGRYCLNTS